MAFFMNAVPIQSNQSSTIQPRIESEIPPTTISTLIPTELIEPLEEIKLEKIDKLEPVKVEGSRTGYESSGRLNYARAYSGYYAAGNCTAGAFQLAPWVGQWNDAKMWAINAHKDGLTVSNTPIVGSVFVSTKGRYGHVGVVQAVNSSTVTVKDMNYRGLYKWTVRDVPISEFVYIYPPN